MSDFSYSFQRPELLTQALTHKSAHFENKGASVGHNEKLEFLGDAVLDLILSELLMEIFPRDGEGSLSKKRASLVNEAVLSEIARDLNLSQHLQLGKGEKQTGGKEKPRLLASVYEALVGAVFMDGGYAKARDWVRSHFENRIRDMDPKDDFSLDFKTRLQELVQAKMKDTPTYVLLNEAGPPHDRTFLIEVRIQERQLASAEGKSKKAAEQEAAKLALEVWQKDEESK